ncbi:hypothetical protein ACFLRF_02220 [Candidatus Altiarchaeota archaeon]
MLFLALCLVGSNVNAMDHVSLTSSGLTGLPHKADFMLNNVSVTVFDNDGDMVGGGIGSCCDMDSDTWILSQGDGTIIVDFETEFFIMENSSRVLATFYDDMNADGLLSYHVVNDTVVVDEESPRLIFFLNESGIENLSIQGYELWFFYRDVSFVDEGNMSLLRFNPGVNASIKKSEFFFGGSNLDDNYLHFIDFSDGPIDTFIPGKVGFELPDFWPIFGPPVSMDIPSSRITDLRLYFSRKLAPTGFITHNISIARYPDTPISPLKKFNTYSWYYSYVDFDSDNITYAVRMLHDKNSHLKTPGYSILDYSIYSWDQDGDDVADFTLMSIPSRERSRMGKKKLPYTVLTPHKSGLVFPRNPYQWVLHRVIPNQPSINIFSVYDGRQAPTIPYFFVNDKFAHYHNFNSEFTLLPLSSGGRIERTKSASWANYTIPLFYYSEIDDRVHLKSIADGSWLIDVLDPSRKYDDGKLKDDVLRDGELAGLDVVKYFDSDNDGFVDEWARYEDDLLTERLLAINPYIILIKDRTYMKKFFFHDPGSPLGIPRRYNEYLFFKKFFEHHGKRDLSTPSQMMDEVPGDILTMDGEILSVKNSDNGVVVEFFCRDICRIDFGDKITTIYLGKYLLLFNGEFILFKTSVLSIDYLMIIDTYFNNHPLILLVIVLVSCTVCFLIWEPINI